MQHTQLIFYLILCCMTSYSFTKLIIRSKKKTTRTAIKVAEYILCTVHRQYYSLVKIQTQLLKVRLVTHDCPSVRTAPSFTLPHAPPVTESTRQTRRCSHVPVRGPAGRSSPEAMPLSRSNSTRLAFADSFCFSDIKVRPRILTRYTLTWVGSRQECT